MRAQRAAEAGDRERAMADAAEIQAVHPEAAALYAELAMEEQLERSIRDRTQALVSTLKDSLDLEAKDVKLRGRNRETLARQVPVPMTLSYQVRQSVQSPQKFELQWEEMWSYRGDAADDGYVLVRRLDLPPLDHGMPLYFRLSMSNQRQAMRFVVSPRGEIVDSTWLRNGPNRGMRPEMLAPEVEGTLRRRRLFDPGESGERGPGDTWRGEDVRGVDGKPVTVPYQAEAVGFTLWDFRTVWAVHCPLLHPPLLPRERLLVVLGEGDTVVPAAHPYALAHHWGGPETLTYPGSHLVPLGKARYVRAVRDWILRRVG